MPVSRETTGTDLVCRLVRYAQEAIHWVPKVSWRRCIAQPSNLMGYKERSDPGSPHLSFSSFCFQVSIPTSTSHYTQAPQRQLSRPRPPTIRPVCAFRPGCLRQSTVPGRLTGPEPESHSTPTRWRRATATQSLNIDFLLRQERTRGVSS
jgi:hypothetical protein